jgi:4-amino-4-deoxy-L-arabinose transferase-like glycosyltransferase
VDALASVGVVAACAATSVAVLAARARRTRAAVLWLVLAAALLRVPPAAHFALSPWDERYHALVAVHALEHPLVPTLVQDPLVEPAADDWKHVRIWLHKPPLATWLMAGAMAVFGANEVALRVPSIFLASFGVWLVFAIARRFASERAALVAAGLAAWQARSLDLVGGLRATDHVDVALTFAVALGALAALRAAEAYGGPRGRFALRTALVGAATALAYYAKETPSLAVIAVFFFFLCARQASWRVRLAAPAAALGVAAALVAPWLIYTANAFPAEAAVARARGAKYFFNVVDHQGGPWWYHFGNLPGDFGWLAPVALVGFAIEAARRRRECWPLLAWFALVYGVFTLAATKMQSYVLIAAPVTFAALGWLAEDALRGWRHHVVLLAICANAAWTALSVEAPLAAQARDPLWASELRGIAAAAEALPPGKRVVFGAPSPTECMFYARATCAGELPSAGEVARARAEGFAVAVYGDAEVEGALRLPLDERTRPARRLAGALRAAGAREALVFNARDAADLREYLVHRIRHASVSADLPRSSRKLARKLKSGATLAVLLPPGTPPPAALHSEFPGALFLEDETYARPLESKSP